MPVSGDIDRHHLIPGFRLDVIERRGHIGHRGIADQYVKPSVAFVKRGSEFVEPAIVPDIERRQRCRAAGRLDCIVEFFETADSACQCNHMSACAAKRQRCRIADAARGAGHERDPVRER